MGVKVASVSAFRHRSIGPSVVKEHHKRSSMNNISASIILSHGGLPRLSAHSLYLYPFLSGCLTFNLSYVAFYLLLFLLGFSRWQPCSYFILLLRWPT